METKGKDRILIIEDEEKVAQMLQKGLIEQGFHAEIATDGLTGLNKALEELTDLIILDINLPILNGFEVCKGIRKSKPDVPILMLTAYGSTDHKLKGFDSGADDYIVKPFEFMELLARLKVFLRRKEVIHPMGNTLRVADLELDSVKMIVQRGGKPINLTAKEFKLLEYLIRNRERVISRTELAEKIWDINFDTGTNIIDVYVNYLRKKIDKDFEPKLIHTVVGMGYRLYEG